MNAHLEGKTERYEYEHPLVLPNGEPKWVQVRGKVVERGPGGVPFRITGTMVDITEKKKIQARLLQADRMASMGALAAGVAHEINNPLAYVVTNIAYSLDELGTVLAAAMPTGGDPGQQCLASVSVLQEAINALREAKEGADRVRKIVRDLKAFSRVDSEEHGAIDVNKVLESSINLARNEIRHRARLATELADVPMIDGSEHRLGQVFLNLLINAAQAIPEGHADENEIKVVSRVQGDGRVAVEIHDTGCGIPRETLRHIFDPFFTTKPAGIGTGLGLSICHGIVGSLGGELTVDSQPGQGSVFRVIVPPSGRAPAQAESPTQAASTAKRGRILVIDDEPNVGRAVRRLLASHHDVEIETCARDALDRLTRGEHFDLVLCDLMMPEMTGMDLHDAVAHVAPEAASRMVFLTGGAFTIRAKEFLEHSTVPRIEKPFDSKALIDMVIHQLNAHAQA